MIAANKTAAAAARATFDAQNAAIARHDDADRRLLADLQASELTRVRSDGSIFPLGPTTPAVSPELVATALVQPLPVLERHGLVRADGEAFLQWLRRPDLSPFDPRPKVLLDAAQHDPTTQRISARQVVLAKQGACGDTEQHARYSLAVLGHLPSAARRRRFRRGLPPPRTDRPELDRRLASTADRPTGDAAGHAAPASWQEAGGALMVEPERVLWSDAGRAARTYLAHRGPTEASHGSRGPEWQA